MRLVFCLEMSEERRSPEWIARSAALWQRTECVKEVTGRHREKLVTFRSDLGKPSAARLPEGSDLVTGISTDTVNINLHFVTSIVTS